MLGDRFRVLRTLAPIIVMVLSLVWLPRAAAANAQATMVEVPGNVSPLVAKAQFVGHADPGQQLHVTVVLTPHDLAELQAQASQRSSVRTVLSRAQYIQRFAPPPADYAAARAFVENDARGTVRTSDDRSRLTFDDTVSNVERLFSTTINMYRLGGRTFFANATNPRVPLSLAGKITYIGGLDDAAAPRHLGAAASPEAVTTAGYFQPADIRSAYNVTPLLNSGLNGSGARIGIVALTPFSPNDISAFETNEDVQYRGALTQLNPNSGCSNQPISSETTLDVEWSMAMAPSADIEVFEVMPGGLFCPSVSDALSSAIYLATTSDANIVSISYGECEADYAPSYMDEIDQTFSAAVVTGKSVVVGSGDHGAFGDYCSATGSTPTVQVDFPASSPNVTAVGGTTLTVSQPNSLWANESGWNCDGATGCLGTQGPTGSGGGCSAHFPEPAWQAGATFCTSRGLPDVSANADCSTPYATYFNGASRSDCGTSAAAPVWAGILADIAQGRSAAHLPPLSLVNPYIYATLTAVSTPNLPFHDIITGPPGTYPVLPRWDAVTGVGSPSALGLAETLGVRVNPTTPPFTQCPVDGLDKSCGILIIVSDTGTSILVDPTQPPLDGIEDTLFGVQNESSRPLNSLSLKANTDLFNFEGDGLCAVIPRPTGCPFGPTRYEGPGVSFGSVGANAESGIVSFANGIPPGGSAYFSLEEALQDTVVSGNLSIVQDFKQNTTQNPTPDGGQGGPWGTQPDCPQTPGSAGGPNCSPRIDLDASPTSPPPDGCDTIFHKGCAITALADVAVSYGIQTIPVNDATPSVASVPLDPGSLNQFWRSIPGTAISCDLPWSVVANHLGDGLNPPVGLLDVTDSYWRPLASGGQKPVPVPSNQIQAALSAGLLPIIHLSVGHYVVVYQSLPNNDFLIVDPWNGSFGVGGNPGGPSGPQIPLSKTFPNAQINEMHVFQRGQIATFRDWRLRVHSPVVLLVTDPYGNQTGYLSTTGAIVEIIPNASYFVGGGIVDPAGVNLPVPDSPVFEDKSPVDGAYLVQVMETGTGPFSIDFLSSTDSGTVSTTTLSGNATPGSTILYRVTYSSVSGGSITISQVSDTTVPSTVATAVPAPNAVGWNRSDVTVSLSAADNQGGSGVKQLTYSAIGGEPITSTTVSGASAQITIAQEGQTTLTYYATDNAGNQEAPKTLTVKLDKTAPVITVGGVQAGATYTNSATPTISLADPNGADGAAGSGIDTTKTVITLDGQPYTSGTPVTAPGAHTLAISTADIAGNVASQTVSFTVVHTTSLAITSSPTHPTGTVTLTATLTDTAPSGAVVPSGLPVAFTVAGQTATGITNSNGVATVTLTLGVGKDSVAVSFAGTDQSGKPTFYLPSSAPAQTLYVYQPTTFVIWGGNPGATNPNVSLGQDYTFWGSQWAKQVTGGDFQANNSFKGYADSVSGASWTSDPGNASGPPTTVASYIGVIVATSATKNGSVESGNVAEIVVLAVDNPAAYQPDPGHSGTGVVVAVVQ